MKRPKRLTADWLTAPANRAVMTALEAARPRGARYVGGCVRDALRGLPAGDIDIATQLLPEAVMAALEAAGIRAVPTGIEHGTVTAVHDGVPVEITTLRRDVETDGRRAVVAFTEDWAEDAARRDFRMNAIYAGADGRLFEVIEGSIADAIAGRVVFIGNADQRLREDYLRILRYYRFIAWLGTSVDPVGRSACARHANGLTQISAERIWKELKRTLAAPNPYFVFFNMYWGGILEVVLPDAWPDPLQALVSAEKAAGLEPDPMRRLMAILPRRQREVREVAEQLKLSNEESSRLLDWADAALPHVLGAGERTIVKHFYRFGPAAVLDRAAIEAASGESGDLGAVVRLAASWQRPKFPLGGADALSAGLKGPAIGEALGRLEEEWIASDFALTREELLSRLRHSD